VASVAIRERKDVMINDDLYQIRRLLRFCLLLARAATIGGGHFRIEIETVEI
jgi:hypothetical protein